MKAVRGAPWVAPRPLAPAPTRRAAPCVPHPLAGAHPTTMVAVMPRGVGVATCCTGVSCPARPWHPQPTTRPSGGVDAATAATAAAQSRTRSLCAASTAIVEVAATAMTARTSSRGRRVEAALWLALWLARCSTRRHNGRALSAVGRNGQEPWLGPSCRRRRRVGDSPRLLVLWVTRAAPAACPRLHVLQARPSCSSSRRGTCPAHGLLARPPRRSYRPALAPCLPWDGRVVVRAS